MTTTPTPSPDAVEALEFAMRNAEAWHADTQYKAGSKDVAEVCIELLNKAGFAITRAPQMSELELEREAMSLGVGKRNGCPSPQDVIDLAKKYRG